MTGVTVMLPTVTVLDADRAHAAMYVHIVLQRAMPNRATTLHDRTQVLDITDNCSVNNADGSRLYR
jgi:hypothetical protein